MRALDQARGRGDGDTEDQQPLTGKGEAADGMIRVIARPGGRLADLELDPRAMRMDSVTLAAAILTAANTALADLQERLRASLIAPDLHALASQLKEVQQESTRQMSGFLQALTDTQARIAAAGRS
jgi:DNA-binding protein YbaB